VLVLDELDALVPGLMLAIAVVGSGDVEGSGVGVLVLSA